MTTTAVDDKFREDPNAADKQKWYPIETAPKDGSEVWLKNGAMRFPVIGRWQLYTSHGITDMQWVATQDPLDKLMPVTGTMVIPTHWAPLAESAHTAPRA